MKLTKIAEGPLSTEPTMLELVRCGVCQSQDLKIYPADEEQDIPLMAFCRGCGSWYHDGPGWIDSEDL